MRALVFDDGLQLRRDYPQPTPGDDEALLRVLKAGVCNTDLELIKGYMGFSGVLGHEFVAEVVAGPESLGGRRVVGEINVADGSCDMCRAGVPSQCRHRTTVGIDRHDGAFADYMALAVRNLYPVPERVSDEAAVFVEPLAAALQITEAVHISPRDRVLVIGIGKLGALCAQVLKLTGAEVIGVVRREAQARLLEGWGIPAADVVALPRQAAQVVVDCTGNEGGFAAALDLLQPRGTLVLKSTYAALPQADLTRVVVDEIKVVGSRCGPFDAALRLLEAGLIDTHSLIETRYSLDDGLQAVERAGQPGALKVLVDVT